MPNPIMVGDLEPGAVDAAVPAHYGDPTAEQRTLDRSVGLVDRSNRGVIAITGPERLSWLHNLTTQHLLTLAPSQGTEFLVLSPHGHIEHDVMLTEDGETAWLDVEPGTAADLVAFLLKMRFMTRAEVADVSVDYALLSLVGPGAADALSRLGIDGLAAPVAQPVPGAKFASVDVAALPTMTYATAPLSGGGWARRHTDRIDLLVPKADVADVRGKLDVPDAGIWAFESFRVAARQPRFGFESDHKTLPAEIELLGPAVHLDKGCYRGQETVARVHNLGRPPRRLALVHLDGIATDQPPATGTEITLDGRAVGFVGSAVRHHELGMIALVVLKRNIPDDAELRIGESVAAIDPT